MSASARIGLVLRIASQRYRRPPSSFSWGVAFAPATGEVWPIETSDRDVAYKTLDGAIVNDRREGVSASRYFGASREGGARRHAGIDLATRPGDPILAMEDGTIVGSIGGYVGLDAVVIDHDHVVIVYAEIAPNALKSAGLKPGSAVRAGQRIGTAASSSSGSMLHVEMWAKGHAPKSFTPWIGSPPAGLLDPTQYLLSLAESS